MSAALVLADPEPATRGFLERHLLDDGFDVLSAEDPREAAECADLVLLGDVGALDRWEPACPVIVLGAAGDDTVDRVRAFQRGCDDYGETACQSPSSTIEGRNRASQSFGHCRATLCCSGASPARRDGVVLCGKPASSAVYFAQMARFEPSLGIQQLDRRSFVPLYYQLQEVLKEQIESGLWKPGDALPSEPELARGFGVSRVVVRQALAILDDDHQIVRIRGRGTFVARPKLDYRAGGLSRLLAAERGSDVTIQVLDKRTTPVERSIRDGLQVPPGADVLRITSSLSVKSVPLAISYSFFADHEVPWLDAAAQVGRNLSGTLTLAQHGIVLAHSQLSIEASQCGQFEADRFGIPHRSAVFLVLCTEHCRTPDGTRPFEVARIEYRGDLLQFRLQASPAGGDAMAAIYELNDEVEELVGPAT